MAGVTEVLDAVAPLDSDPLVLRQRVVAAMSTHAERAAAGEHDGVPWRSRTRVLRRGHDESPVGPGDELLLVYVLAVADGPERYVTAFPISASFCGGMMASTEQRPKFNAVIS